MADRIHKPAEDPIKKRLRELKLKPVLNARETKEAIEKILDHLKIK